MKSKQPVRAEPFTSTDMRIFLQGLPVFIGVSEKVLSHLERVCHLKRVNKGQYIFFQDDPGETAYVVRKGTIAILLTMPDGRELIINEMREGDLFGDIGSLLGQPRTASAIAQENSEIVVIPQPEFLSILDQEPRVLRNILEIVAQRLRISTEHESALAFLSSPARLARILLQLSEQQKRTAGLVVVSQEELGRRLGVTRQTIAKTLGRWRRVGWIITGRGKIMLLDKQILRRLSEELAH
jgi:CRP/FNR family cyclic AMP-dependent transcriptional regulator